MEVVEYRFKPRKHLYEYITIINAALDREIQGVLRNGLRKIVIIGPKKMLRGTPNFCLVYRVATEELGKSLNMGLVERRKPTKVVTI